MESLGNVNCLLVGSNLRMQITELTDKHLGALPQTPSSPPEGSPGMDKTPSIPFELRLAASGRIKAMPLRGAYGSLDPALRCKTAPASAAWAFNG